MKHYDYPFFIDAYGKTAKVNYEQHIRNLIEQVLFTNPGERVNNPPFGSGVSLLVFAPNSDDLVVTTKTIVQSSLSDWLGELILVDSVDIHQEESMLVVVVKYRIRTTQSEKIDEFKREIL